MFLSVIMPCYNSNEKLLMAMNSLLKQKHLDDIEILLIDDCSTDTSIINQFKDNKYVTFIRSDENLGLTKVRQLGLEKASGDWLFFMDHDDSVTEDAFDAIWDTLKSSNEALCVISNMIITNNFMSLVVKEYKVQPGNGAIHGMFFNKQKMNEFGIYFPTNLKTHEDTFISLITSGLAFINPELIVRSDLITYIWYLWEDSTSHKDGEGVFFIENFKDYLDVNIMSHDFIIDKIHSKKYSIDKAQTFLMYIYLTYEKYRDLIIEKNQIENIKYAVNWCINKLNMSKESVYKLLCSYDGLYAKAIMDVTDSYGYFVPQSTLKDFIYEFSD